MTGTLYLIPNTLGNSNPDTFLPSEIRGFIPSLKFLIVENIRNARRYLKIIDQNIDIDSITFFELNKHTQSSDIIGFLDPVINGNDTGILSEAGVPGVADPGAEVVKLAHQRGVKVVPWTGPSSILMALMASGLNGQSFRFLGYLPVKGPARIQTIKQLENKAIRERETQIFIETPYRNDQMMNDLISTCQPGTLLTVAVDLTIETESIMTLSIAEWKKKKPELHKRPAVFLLGT